MNEDLLSGPEPGPDELRAIVSRASKRRWRTVGVAAVVALAAGGGIGYGVSNHSGGGQTVVAGSSSPTSVSEIAPGIASSSEGASSGAIAGPALSPNLTRLFVRDANGVTVRGYLTDLRSSGTEPACASLSWFQSEVSTQYSVGQLNGFTISESSQPIKGAQAELLGVRERDPVYVVVVNTAPDVARLKMTFAHGGTDQMSPVSAWAALAAEFPASDLPPSGQFSGPVGTLEAFGSTGQVLQTMTVNLGINPLPALKQGCSCPPMAYGSGAPRSGANASTAAPAGVCPQPGTVKSNPPVSLPVQTLPAQGVPPPNGTSTSAVSSGGAAG